MILILVQNVETIYLSVVDHMANLWDVAIIQNAGILENYKTNIVLYTGFIISPKKSRGNLGFFYVKNKEIIDICYKL